MTELHHSLLQSLAQIKQHYLQVDEKMQGLPLYHPGLEVEVTPYGLISFDAQGLQGQGLLAGVVTPWCINALLLPLVWPLNWPYRTGAEITLQLPADTYVMLLNEQGFLSLSLFSETRQLEDQEAAQVFLKTALQLLATAPEPVPEKASSNTPKPLEQQLEETAATLDRVLHKPVSRRNLFGRGG